MHHPILRGIAFVTMFFLATATGHAADKLIVGKASPTSSPMLPVDVGVKTGIFAKHGLDVQIENFGGGGKMHQAAAAGAIDIGVGAGPELALIAKGSPELAICNAVGPATFLGIAVPAELAGPYDRRSQKQNDCRLEQWLSHLLAGAAIGAQGRLGR